MYRRRPRRKMRRSRPRRFKGRRRTRAVPIGYRW